MWVVGCTPLVWEGRAVVRRLMSSGLQGPPLFICRGFFVYLRACLRPVSVVSCPETVYVEIHPRLGTAVGRESSRAEIVRALSAEDLGGVLGRSRARGNRDVGSWRMRPLLQRVFNYIYPSAQLVALLEIVAI